MTATVVIATSPDALEAHAPAWDQLAAAALEPNVFQESWMALAGWRAFGTQAAIQAVLIYQGIGSTASSGWTACRARGLRL